MSAVCIIPARGGSRRIPRKNIKLFHGKPIIAYSIEAAKESGLFDMIVVSTDDLEIADIATAHGIGVVPRGYELSKDEIGTQEVTRHALEWCNWANAGERPKYTCCVYPVCPMLATEDLRSAWWHLLDDGVPFVYVPGYYYFGHTTNFIEGIPLTEGLALYFPPERYVDVNTPDDWSKMDKMYTALHPEVA